MRLLLIRPGALGDTLLTFPVIEALRAHSDNPHVTLVGNKAVLPLARAFGLAEEVFDYEDALWSGLFATPSSDPVGTDYANEQINLNTQPPAGTDLLCPPEAKIRDADTIERADLQIGKNNLCRDPIYRVRDLSKENSSKVNFTYESGDKSADAINRVPTTDKNPYSNGIGINPISQRGGEAVRAGQPPARQPLRLPVPYTGMSHPPGTTFKLTPMRRNLSLRSVLSGIDRVVAWLSDPDNIVYQNLQAAGIPQVTVVPGRSSAQERMHVVDYLACSVGVSTNPHPRYGDCFSVADSMPGQERAFAIHPGSGGARKCWPPERFAAVIQRLWLRDWPVLLLSGPADHERLEVLLKLLPAPPQTALLKLLVDVPLLDLVPVLCQCRGYLGNDAGMTHLAALLGLPTLALFGPTDPLIWQPRGRAVRIIHEPDLEELGAERVMEYIRSIERL